MMHSFTQCTIIGLFFLNVNRDLRNKFPDKIKPSLIEKHSISDLHCSTYHKIDRDEIEGANQMHILKQIYERNHHLKQIKQSTQYQV